MRHVLVVASRTRRHPSPQANEVATAMRRWGSERVASGVCPHRVTGRCRRCVPRGVSRHADAPVPRESDEALKAWLLRCTINRCNDLGRASSKRPHADWDDVALDRLPSPSADTLPESCLVAREEQRALWEAVSRLEPTFRDVVHLHYAEGLTCRQIADIVSCSVAAVHVRLHRARRHLGTPWKEEQTMKRMRSGKIAHRSAADADIRTAYRAMTDSLEVTDGLDKRVLARVEEHRDRERSDDTSAARLRAHRPVSRRACLAGFAAAAATVGGLLVPRFLVPQSSKTSTTARHAFALDAVTRGDSGQEGEALLSPDTLGMVPVGIGNGLLVLFHFDLRRCAGEGISRVTYCIHPRGL